jgi:Asp-tRNA(Asn)/Glu-tRNA(Gln) amidotransferase A subunit family amidase
MLSELTGAVRARRVSAVELVRHALELIERLNPTVNAVIALRAEEALAEAKALDESLARGQNSTGPLAGVPFLVKDNMDLAGLPTRQGSLLFADALPATRDNLTPARLRAAGAIPIGKTNVSELCIEAFVDNRLFGTTCNPWAPQWSPGGSSGGTAAAMAAGMIPFGTATDGGGSVRIPAACCGLFGLKPTVGVIARDPIPDWMDFSTDGPIGLTIGDVRLLLSIQAGPWPGDPTALPVPSALSDALPRPSVVYAAQRFVNWGPLPAEIDELFRGALADLQGALGLRVEFLEPDQVLRSGNADEDWFVTAEVEHVAALGRETIETNADRFTAPALVFLRSGMQVAIDEYLAARRRRFDYVRELDLLLGIDAVIVTPTMTEVGWLADGSVPGRGEPGTDGSCYNTQAQNLTGHPALTVPAGRASNGVPFGLQITGPRFRDDLVLAVGERWEQIHPGGCVADGYDKFWE